jgi:hypothetical protein
MTLSFALLIGLALGFFVQGFLRRRRSWTARSWRRFGLALALSLLLSAGGLFLALRLDEGWQLGNTPGMRAFSFFTMVAVALFAFTTPIHLLGWFATANPQGQFGRTQTSGDHSPNTR